MTVVHYRSRGQHDRQVHHGHRRVLQVLLVQSHRIDLGSRRGDAYRSAQHRQLVRLGRTAGLCSAERLRKSAPAFTCNPRSNPTDQIRAVTPTDIPQIALDVVGGTATGLRITVEACRPTQMLVNRGESNSECPLAMDYVVGPDASARSRHQPTYRWSSTSQCESRQNQSQRTLRRRR